jgi:predicted ATP-grasp superfamily ATP-dependent carboligase
VTALPPVFLTYGWCRVSYVILDSLARRGVEVHVGDASGLAMCRFSRRVASFRRYRNPYRDPEGFVDDVAAAMRETGARVLIPGHEDIVVAARHRDRLPEEAILPAGDATLLARALNKWETTEMAREAGVAVPESFVPATREELLARAPAFTYPAIVKTQLGNSGKGVFAVRDAEECVARYDAVVADYRLEPPAWPIVQAFARGTGYGVCLLFNRGEYRAGFCERYIRCKDGQFGTSVFRESVEVPALLDAGRRLLESVGWHGVAHLDFIYDEATGEHALIEINPRFWGALDLAVRSGVDFPWLLYRMAIDGDVAPVEGYRTGVASRWIVGEMLHEFNLVKRGNLSGAARAAAEMLRRRPAGCDDFRPSDPAPLFVEMLYYGSKFLATGSTNPIEEGMVG